MGSDRFDVDLISHVSESKFIITASQTMDSTHVTSREDENIMSNIKGDSFAKESGHILENKGNNTPKIQNSFAHKGSDEGGSDLCSDITEDTNKEGNVDGGGINSMEVNITNVDGSEFVKKESSQDLTTCKDFMRPDDESYMHSPPNETDLKYVPDEFIIDENEKSQDETIVPSNDNSQPHRELEYIQTRRDRRHNQVIKVNGTENVDNKVPRTTDESNYIISCDKSIETCFRNSHDDDISDHVATISDKFMTKMSDRETNRFFKIPRSPDRFSIDLIDSHSMNKFDEKRTRRNISNVKSKVDHSWHKNYPILKQIQSGSRSTLTIPNLDKLDKFHKDSAKQRTHRTDTILTQTLLERKSALRHERHCVQDQIDANAAQRVNSAGKSRDKQRHTLVKDDKYVKYGHEKPENTYQQRQHKHVFRQAQSSQTESGISMSSGGGNSSGHRHSACIPDYTKSWLDMKFQEQRQTDKGTKSSQNLNRGLTQSLPDTNTVERNKCKQKLYRNRKPRENVQRAKDKYFKENEANQAVILPDIGVFYTNGNAKETARLNWYNNTKEVSMTKAVEISKSRSKIFNDEGVKRSEIHAADKVMERTSKEIVTARQWQYRSIDYDLEISSDKSSFILPVYDEPSSNKLSRLRSSPDDIDKFLHGRLKYKVCLNKNRMHYLQRKPTAKHHCDWPE